MTAPWHSTSPAPPAAVPLSSYVRLGDGFLFIIFFLTFSLYSSFLLQAGGATSESPAGVVIDVVFPLFLEPFLSPSRSSIHFPAGYASFSSTVRNHILQATRPRIAALNFSTCVSALQLLQPQLEGPFCPSLCVWSHIYETFPTPCRC